MTDAIEHADQKRSGAKEPEVPFCDSVDRDSGTDQAGEGTDHKSRSTTDPLHHEGRRKSRQQCSDIHARQRDGCPEAVARQRQPGQCRGRNDKGTAGQHQRLTDGKKQDITAQRARKRHDNTLLEAGMNEDTLRCLHRTVMALSAGCPPKVRRWYYMPRRYLPPTSKNAWVNWPSEQTRAASISG